VKALFDTNILIDYLSGVAAADVEISRYRDRSISVITWMEVLVGVRGSDEADVVELFLRDFRLVDVTRSIAREAVAVRQSTRMRLPDAIILASARVETALLVTRNSKDFPRDDPAIRVPY